MNQLTAERLRKILSYTPETGEFRWLVTTGRRSIAGNVAGTIDAEGYRRITIAGQKYRAARLAWLYMTGEWPVDEVDHEDLNTSNDRWKNLRQATSSQNNCNRRKRRDNTSGFKGVVWSKEHQKWRANITVRGKKTHLGMFDSPEAGQAAYIAAAQNHHGKFSRPE